MRWLVEVTSLGRTEKDSLYVDAESWQKALQVARTLRGETDPMSGFSIELLDEGCRAVDPATRISYEVHRAAGDGGAPALRARPRPTAASETPAPRRGPPLRPPPRRSPSPAPRARRRATRARLRRRPTAAPVAGPSPRWPRRRTLLARPGVPQSQRARPACARSSRRGRRSRRPRR